MDLRRAQSVERSALVHTDMTFCSMLKTVVKVDITLSKSKRTTAYGKWKDNIFDGATKPANMFQVRHTPYAIFHRWQIYCK